jgi:hypothetical protein
VFGDEDRFFRRFAAMIKRGPVPPLIGDRTTRFNRSSSGEMAAGLMH